MASIDSSVRQAMIDSDIKNRKNASKTAKNVGVIVDPGEWAKHSFEGTHKTGWIASIIGDSGVTIRIGAIPRALSDTFSIALEIDNTWVHVFSKEAVGELIYGV